MKSEKGNKVNQSHQQKQIAEPKPITKKVLAFLFVFPNKHKKVQDNPFMNQKMTE